ncbi:unnamed protein product [Tilletia laevis]|nr:unnamed protein product [Tilletia caries]CAD6957210.1 unnamed protein product [Tilletia caries]CAD6965876.1 unnamed protein product [Tilletia laevis]
MTFLAVHNFRRKAQDQFSKYEVDRDELLKVAAAVNDTKASEKQIREHGNGSHPVLVASKDSHIADRLGNADAILKIRFRRRTARI